MKTPAQPGLTLTRTGGSDGAVSVAVGNGNGSATAGQDYTPFNTTVNFAAGDAAAKTVTVSIINDTVSEPAETVSLALSAPTGGATLGTNATATLTIRDNDELALAVQSDIKQLIFSWSKLPDAVSYRLLRDPDGASMSAMLDTIGYFKASNSQSSDRFGSAVAISADGSTLAVGAPFEDSNAVADDQSNNDAQDAGARLEDSNAVGINHDQGNDIDHPVDFDAGAACRSPFIATAGVGRADQC